jgi:hypothetical protein
MYDLKQILAETLSAAEKRLDLFIAGNPGDFTSPGYQDLTPEDLPQRLTYPSIRECPFALSLLSQLQALWFVAELDNILRHPNSMQTHFS